MAERQTGSGWQMRSLSHEDGKDEISSHCPAKRLQIAPICLTPEIPCTLTCFSLPSFQVLRSSLLGLALPEAEFDSGKINVSKVLKSLPKPCPHAPDPNITEGTAQIGNSLPALSTSSPQTRPAPWWTGKEFKPSRCGMKSLSCLRRADC